MRAQLQPISLRGIYLGLGSNLGDRLAYLAFAKQHFHIIAESPVYESPAMLPNGAAAAWNKPFLNQVIEIETDLSPKELLAMLKRIEREAGRRDRGRWAPRELDLDIIAYGDVLLDTPELKLPHVGMSQRDFVLLPLRDIAPGYDNIDTMIAELSNITAIPWRKCTQIMGILNITPDSFSDGGDIDVEAILAKFEKLVQDGADIIDIGAESTRPEATPLAHAQEWQRLELPLQAIMAHRLRRKVRISIDTRHAATAKLALEMGVDIINDVSGLGDVEMVETLKSALCDVVVMHSLSVPVDKDLTLPEDCDTIAEILKWKKSILHKGIAPERLIFDPGVGFGKTAVQSLALIERADELVKSGGRWLIGHSRKSFMNVSMEERDALTLRYSQGLLAKRIDILRVHDVAAHQDMLARVIEKKPGVPGIKLTLERLQGLLDALGNPEKRLPPVIHIAGTNGKGSTLAYLRAVYEAAGKRVHTYTSPHLVRYNERVILAGQEVSDAQFMDALLRVKAKETNNPITIFERITAAAYLCFSEVPADILLLETGMGGRLDATNIPAKIMALLTPIAMDHAEFLGDTLTQIAGEKVAIMRSGVPCISTPQVYEVEAVITSHAVQIGASLHWATNDKSLNPSLVGEHQRMNASLAAAAARALGISEEAITQGVARAIWPARLQRLERGALLNAWGKRGNVMLDGGHNTHAAEALVAWIKEQDRPVILACGMMARKSAGEWMNRLLPHVSELICLPVSGGDAYAPELLAAEAVAAHKIKVSTAESLEELAQMLSDHPVALAHVLVAGSLYLAGDVLKTHG